MALHFLLSFRLMKNPKNAKYVAVSFLLHQLPLMSLFSLLFLCVCVSADDGPRCYEGLCGNFLEFLLPTAAVYGIILITACVVGGISFCVYRKQAQQQPRQTKVTQKKTQQPPPQTTQNQTQPPPAPQNQPVIASQETQEDKSKTHRDDDQVNNN